MNTSENDTDLLAALVGQRLAAWLKQAYPLTAKAKRVAADFGVDERTAQGWLTGALPKNKHMLAMKARYGWKFVAFIYEPFDWAGKAELRARLDALDRELVETRRLLRETQASGGAD